MFDQTPYQLRMEWGFRGARDGAKRGDIVVIVDVLSFSTTTTAACAIGATIYPHPYKKDGLSYARRVDAELIVGRAESSLGGLPSLSPVSFQETHRGRRFVLCSLNGARCAQLASGAPDVLIASLNNAKALAETLMTRYEAHPVTFICCGEQWSDPQEDDNEMRPCIEDYLGAGAVISEMRGSFSPEAELCGAAFSAAKEKINDLIWESGSGRELRARGYAADVEYAAQLSNTCCVPKMHEGGFFVG